MDAQQLAGKVAQLETRVATLEDEGKITKGEVKQILTEIRSAILARENPFDNSASMSTPFAIVAPEPIAPPPAPAAQPDPALIAPPVISRPEPVREPVPMRPNSATPPAPVHVQQPDWSLLTIAGLSAWAEDAMRRLGALRVEILLDLCQASGHMTADVRQALARITELDAPEPVQAPSQNETAAILRQLDALLADGEEQPSIRSVRAA